MLILTILTLALLAVINYHIGPRSLFSPPVVFCGIWSFDLFLVWAVGNFFFPLLPETLLVFTFGAMFFSIGSYLAKAIPASPKEPDESYNKITTALCWLIVVSFPLFVRWILAITGAKEGSSILMAARMVLVEMEGDSIALTIFGNLLLLATIVSLIGYRENQGHKRRAWIVLFASLTMSMLTGTKGAPLALVLGLLYINWLKTRRIRWRAVGTTVIIFAAVIALVEYTVHINAPSVEESAMPVINNATMYVSGGIIAFDQVMRNPHVVPLANPVYDIAMRVLKRLGYHADVVAAHGYEYVDIGPNNLINNTYSVYGSWIAFGPLGMVSAMGLLGFVSGLAFKRALLGGRVAAIFYAVLFPGIFFSPFHDYLTAVIWLAMVLLVSWFVYYFPLRWAQFKSLLTDIVRADLAKSQLHR